MRALLSIVYGLAAYLAFSATLLWFIGFSGNLLVPRSIDIGGAGLAWPQALAIDLSLVLLFGLQHSVMARRGFKRWWTRVVPPVVERSTYVVASSLVLALVMLLWVPIATPVAWRVEGPAAALLWTGFGLGWAITALSTFLLDHFELFGLRQVFTTSTGRRAPTPEMRTPLLYRHVRHPLYLGFLITFWSVPVMTLGHLVFSLGMSAYVLAGIAFEERDLVQQFGERYRVYRRQVGMLLPRIGGADRASRQEASDGGPR
jgi:protein-S-isoprenylcysteine O-methyltransferase Ste14